MAHHGGSCLSVLMLLLTHATIEEAILCQKKNSERRRLLNLLIKLPECHSCFAKRSLCVPGPRDFSIELHFQLAQNRFRVRYTIHIANSIELPSIVRASEGKMMHQPLFLLHECAATLWYYNRFLLLIIVLSKTVLWVNDYGIWWLYVTWGWVLHSIDYVPQQ